MENNNTKSVPKKRLEYIDAMRGFTMILVVVSHIYLYCMKSDITTPQNLNFYLIQCRMPLFFLVSGFVFYKCIEWKLQDILSFFKKKIMVQFVSPLIFLCLYAYMTHNNLVEALCDDYKLGYWFTFTLLEYYIIYIILYRICSCFNCSPRLFDVINIIVGILLTVFRFETLVDKLPFHTFASTLGILQISYYQFFVVGTIIKRNWTRVVSLLQNPKPIMLITGAYFIINIFAFEWADIQVVSKLISLLCSYLGVCIIFSFFYSNAEHFYCKKTCWKGVAICRAKNSRRISAPFLFAPYWSERTVPYANSKQVSDCRILVLSVCGHNRACVLFGDKSHIEA